jgi:dipeptidyl aminopeptidase/acylaminoacyl peptidase
MSTPEENADGYATSSVVRQARLLTQRNFLIIHGNIDENVHFENSTALMQQVDAADTPETASMHELIELPGERHSARYAISSL